MELVIDLQPSGCIVLKGVTQSKNPVLQERQTDQLESQHYYYREGLSKSVIVLFYVQY
jgi:hypothetical protein